MSENSFGAKSTLEVGGREYEIYRLDALRQRYDVARLPFSLKVLLENLLRTEGNGAVEAKDIEALAGWDAQAQPSKEIAFTPARVLMQDFTGVPAVVDLAAMRDAIAEMGGDAAKINPLAPAELVIDHSVQVDAFGTRDSFRVNAEREFERNQERYAFLRWGQGAFEHFAVVPPDTGIVHQVNLEYLARVVFSKEAADGVPAQAYPDTLVGTDSHTTMVNGLGVLGWGVGGIEAEAAMLGQPLSMLIPRVLGVRLHGELPEGATATDLVLTVTELLRERGVVGTFVEFYGAGLAGLPIADRATIGNMSPEFGSTCAIFPIDAETLRYMELSGRPPERIALTEAYAKAQGLWHDERSEQPTFSDTVELDLGEVVPSLAGPKRPQDRVTLSDAREGFRVALADYLPAQTGAASAAGGEHAASEETGSSLSFPASDPPSNVAPRNGDGPRDERPAPHKESAPGEAAELARAVAERMAGTGTQVTMADGTETELDHGHVVIAAITSCTNTSNPSVMIGAGILARNAVAKGLKTKPWVKTSLAPGSKVVTEYLDRAGLTEPLEQLGFNLVGYGCTTCIGNSGPLPQEISQAVADADLAVVSVLSGNRNFAGRNNQDVKMNYLASPPLCVAYALVGTMDADIVNEPIGRDAQGEDVYLKDIWPSEREIAQTIGEAVNADMFHKSYGEVFAGDERWNGLEVPQGERFAWDEHSTYVQLPPYFKDMPAEPEPVRDVADARVLALLGDSVTTDHISPAGAIKRDGPAGRYLQELGVAPRDFNSYGSRRGNHEVMMRGTFANIRLHNLIGGGDPLPEGGVTRHLPDGEQMSIYDAAIGYAGEGVELVVLAGKEYGSGSSRDWAAKGTMLLGVRAVIAESFERIHRSNLVGMGVLPLQFPEGQSADSLGLSGEEVFSIEGLAEAMADGGAPPKT
ncbi:MAG: aconitate hydratase, partial [Solirubrobacteraceae bacterium]